ncbi:unnamed protein product [Mycena citricolor]|uniref:Uncharacterized protein n=1 Tax=Mycena citricolor TaxID=2018698 RepID=A0AAD2Q2C4_9AGAR|nr:unnamed protein product [Mycena citricolor]
MVLNAGETIWSWNTRIRCPPSLLGRSNQDSAVTHLPLSKTCHSLRDTGLGHRKAFDRRLDMITGGKVEHGFVDTVAGHGRPLDCNPPSQYRCRRDDEIAVGHSQGEDSTPGSHDADVASSRLS